MKFGRLGFGLGLVLSHPVRGAWIEIPPLFLRDLALKSHPVRGAWIEIAQSKADILLRLASHPVRGAWIEIRYCSTADRGQWGRTP